MNRFVGCLVLACVAPLSAQGLTPVVPHSGGGLRPDALAREFKRDEWRAALLQEDLELREQSYDALLGRARLDPAARAFLEELARDPAAGELAWTARLALRELGRARFSAARPLLGATPFGLSGRMDEELQRLFEGLQPGLMRSEARGRSGTAAGRMGANLQIFQGPNGARIDVVETIDGEEQRRTYEGPSLDAILAEHPELLNGGPRAGAGGAQSDGRTFAHALGAEVAPPPTMPDKLGVIVQPLTAQHASELGLGAGVGLYVERTQPGSYADQLGVQGGDVLLELDGRALGKVEDLERGMQARARSADLALTWIDGRGERRTKTWKAATPAPK